jgi:hypothetical protein
VKNFHRPTITSHFRISNSQDLSQRLRQRLAERFYGINEFVSQSGINPANYKTLFPLMVFDVSKQSERLKTETINVNIYATFNTAVPANTQAYALVISDKLLQFQSDGKGMAVVYLSEVLLK